MGVIKKWIHVKSVKKDFALYLLLYIIISLLFGFFGSRCCLSGQQVIIRKYQDSMQSAQQDVGYRLYDADGDHVWINYYTQDLTQFLEPFDNLAYNLLGIGSVLVYPFSFIVCIGITSMLFYKRKLHKPLEILNSAADSIAADNLAFTIRYDRRDELGKLCMSFEKMRAALQDNHLEMWRQIEERKRLNAAFAHDLRTPLTVLKGQSEMLISYAPNMSKEQMVETVSVMGRHIARLETYVDTMHDLQRLEDLAVQKQWMAAETVVEQMEETAGPVSGQKKFVLQKKLDGAEKLEIDVSVVMRVYENLLANAVRYARETVTVSVCMKKGCFQITVSDDGQGFSAKELAEAAKPFYKSKETKSGQFGMGLYICKVLCEKHGGLLRLSNNGGACVTAAFSCRVFPG